MADVFVHRSFPSRFELHMYNSGNNFISVVGSEDREGEIEANSLSLQSLLLIYYGAHGYEAWCA
jgi:hypothetical protein